MPDDDASSLGTLSTVPAVASPLEAPAATAELRVLLPLPLPHALDYLAAEGMPRPEPGSFVRVPLGSRAVVGVVWEGADGGPPAGRLKAVGEVLPVPPLRL